MYGGNFYPLPGLSSCLKPFDCDLIFQPDNRTSLPKKAVGSQSKLKIVGQRILFLSNQSYNHRSFNLTNPPFRNPNLKFRNKLTTIREHLINLFLSNDSNPDELQRRNEIARLARWKRVARRKRVARWKRAAKCRRQPPQSASKASLLKAS